MRNKRIILIMLSFFILFNIFGIQKSYAQEQVLENLDISVFINEDGSANIRQRREGTFTEGTENYLVMENLGESQIKDFKVFEGEREYESIDDWDIDDSREEKTFKNGIINTDDGYELAWGIGEYGEHVYNLEYTVTNFIKELEDNQILFWRFVNDQTNTPPQNLQLAIQSNQAFNQEDQKIWGFGYEGEIGFSEDGMIVARSTQPLSEDNYVTILVKFDQGVFATDDYIDKSFEEVKDEALEGSDYGGRDESDGGVFSILSRFIFPLIVGFGFLGVFKNFQKDKPGNFKRKYEEEYYRDYPYEGNILDIYYILYTMGLSDFENILTGFILKWIKEEKIEVTEEKEGMIFKKDTTQIKILDESLPEEEMEAELYDALLQAAGGNRILEEKEFTKWAKTNHSYISDWEKKAKRRSIEKLKSLGYLEVGQKGKFIFKTKEYQLVGKGQEIEENIYKYINYLHDFSLLNEHEAVNVKLWDNIMIWAGFLGVTEVVKEQFEKIYPDYVEETVYTGSTIYLAHSLTRNVSHASSSAARSSGLGGSTSIGGGGGSFGGGSGGGTR